MVQRAGRIDRIGTSFNTLSIINMYPDDGLEKLLGLVESLSQKIANIDRNGLLDASILGEVVHPQNFNTLRRIEAEDGKVVEEQEQFIELVSSEFLLQNLKSLLNTGLRETVEALPMVSIAASRTREPEASSSTSQLKKNTDRMPPW